MRVLDVYSEVSDGFVKEKVMLVPSFTMFQSAINAKAKARNRASVDLVPTYGYINSEDYADLKSRAKLAMALYFPEIDGDNKFNNASGKFRLTVDGHPKETSFGGTIHDVYHALREIAMSENVAKARFRLAAIAKAHPNNKLSSRRAIDDILIDGELIHSYPIETDSIYENFYRPDKAEKFGDIFYTNSLKGKLDDRLKYAFIYDMVANSKFWQEEYGIGKDDLRDDDKILYEIIELALSIPGINKSMEFERVIKESNKAVNNILEDRLHNQEKHTKQVVLARNFSKNATVVMFPAAILSTIFKRRYSLPLAFSTTAFYFMYRYCVNAEKRSVFEEKRIFQQKAEHKSVRFSI